jgi:hypothetical protein
VAILGSRDGLCASAPGGEAIPLMATVVRRDVAFYINNARIDVLLPAGSGNVQDGVLDGLDTGVPDIPRGVAGLLACGLLTP